MYACIMNNLYDLANDALLIIVSTVKFSTNKREETLIIQSQLGGLHIHIMGKSS